MTPTRTPSRVEFGGFTFDEDAGTLLKAGRAVPLSDKGIGALRLLLRKRPATVLKEEFLDLLWPDTDVEVNSVAAVIADLRRALGDTRETPRFVQTHFRNGYRFIGEVRDLAASQPPELNHSQCWLQWRDQRFKLGRRDIVGRDLAIPSGSITRPCRVCMRRSWSAIQRRASRTVIVCTGPLLRNRRSAPLIRCQTATSSGSAARASHSAAPIPGPCLLSILKTPHRAGGRCREKNADLAACQV